MTFSTDRTVAPARSAGRRVRSARPTARGLAATLGLIAAGVLLTACSKPQPSITVFSGSTAKAVSAQAPCVLDKSCTDDPHKVVDITVRPGSTLLLDVSRDLANAGWIATAYTQDSSGASTSIPGAGTAKPVQNLSARLQVPQADGAYLVRVTSVRPTNQLTTWLVRVTLGQ
ncbi:MAG: hypothetical protein QOH56_2746 [Pseudonocardiales bacterium]|nr:hypothetical protein [Pseudonocardiales bacterium]